MAVVFNDNGNVFRNQALVIAAISAWCEHTPVSDLNQNSSSCLHQAEPAYTSVIMMQTLDSSERPNSQSFALTYQIQYNSHYSTLYLHNVGVDTFAQSDFLISRLQGLVSPRAKSG